MTSLPLVITEKFLLRLIVQKVANNLADETLEDMRVCSIQKVTILGIQERRKKIQIEFKLSNFDNFSNRGFVCAENDFSVFIVGLIFVLVALECKWQM